MQAPGIEHEDFDRQRGARDGVGEHHVLGGQAARQSNRRELCRDVAEERLDHARWYETENVSNAASASAGSSPSRSSKASKPTRSMK
jgi:hypothetical protein